ncbi:MAG: hypothetical protein ACOY90_05025 [Candidatus Zhuqueibacterota bacterium]
MYDTLHKSVTGIIILGWFFLVLSASSTVVQSASPSTFQSAFELVILADANDPYYSLAEEIATTEKAPIFHTLSDAVNCHPIFLIWVVSPSFLSDFKVIEFGLAMKEQPYAISTGIITASTLEDARNLWDRRSHVQGQSLFAVNATYPSAHVYEGRIIDFTHEQQVISPLTKESFNTSIQAADYLTFTGHGGSSYLRLDEDLTFTTDDVPPLYAIILSTASCQTFRPWEENSIALKFADQGVAAYSGFVYSPIEGYLLGEFDGLPFRYTWSDFPIGHVIQIQNRGTIQGFAAFPFRYLLGDPRISLQSAPPYQLVDDHINGEHRVLTFRDVPKGVIPIRISNGAEYHFVEVLDGTSAAEHDFFYNSQLQMVNFQNDKFVLLVHKGGDLTLELHAQAPWYWIVGDILLDSLDHTYIFNPQSSGDILSMLFALIPLIWGIWQFHKKRFGWKDIRLALVIGLGMSVLLGIYAFIRLDDITIISKDVVYSPLNVIANFLLGACGVLIYIRARSLTGKSIALFVMTFSSWSGALFFGLWAAIPNIFLFKPQIGATLYNYSLALLPAIAFFVTFIGISLFMWLVMGKNTTRHVHVP